MSDGVSVMDVEKLVVNELVAESDVVREVDPVMLGVPRKEHVFTATNAWFSVPTMPEQLGKKCLAQICTKRLTNGLTRASFTRNTGTSMKCTTSIAYAVVIGVQLLRIIRIRAAVDKVKYPVSAGTCMQPRTKFM